MARVGVDYVCVDAQHGMFGYDAMVPMLQAICAAGVAPITRVVRNDPGEIGKALDAGAWGVIVPLVSSAEEAARAWPRVATRRGECAPTVPSGHPPRPA
jgi:4-hydroxy-2-oxoheptanedioate aldolase